MNSYIIIFAVVMSVGLGIAGLTIKSQLNKEFDRHDYKLGYRDIIKTHDELASELLANSIETKYTTS